MGMKLKVYLMLFVALLFINEYRLNAQTSEKIKIIIDADTANEVDDLFAIVSALVEPKFEVLAINAAQFHTSPLASKNSVQESQSINEDILSLMNMEHIPALIGSNNHHKDSATAESSDASKFIIDQAHLLGENEKLHVAILGPCTNVAAAIIEDPSIISKLSVHYIGFWHKPSDNSYNIKEFNSRNDYVAVNHLLNTKGLDFNVMSATTCQHLVFKKKSSFKHLDGKPGIKQYLVDRWNSYKRWFRLRDKKKKKWIMWDVAIIEALAKPALATKQVFKTPPKNTQRNIDIYTKIDVEKMEAYFWSKLDDL